MKRLLPFLLIPVFLTYGPNAVGYKTIIDTTLDDPAIQEGSTVACNWTTEYGDHRLVEGKLKRVEVLGIQLPFLLVDTPLFKEIPMPLLEDSIEFCVASGENK